MLVLSSLWALPARAACPQPVPPSHIAALLDEAEAAFLDLDIETFVARSDEIRSDIPCASALLEPALVARIHRTEGLRLFGDRSPDAVCAFAASRAIEPDYVFPPELVPPGSPILADVTALDPTVLASEILPEPASGTLYLDGIASRQRRVACPALIQLISADATPIWSAYLRHDQPLPPYDAMTQDRALPEVIPQRRSPRIPLGVAGASSALLAGAAYGAAWSTRAVWADPETDDARLDALRFRTNALTSTSLLATIATIGFGTALVITW